MKSAVRSALLIIHYHPFKLFQDSEKKRQLYLHCLGYQQNLELAIRGGKKMSRSSQTSLDLHRFPHEVKFTTSFRLKIQICWSQFDDSHSSAPCSRLLLVKLCSVRRMPYFMRAYLPGVADVCQLLDICRFVLPVQSEKGPSIHECISHACVLSLFLSLSRSAPCLGGL